MVKPVEYFQDSLLLQKIPQEADGSIFIDFVKTPLGQTARAEFYVKNIVLDDPIQLKQPFVTDERLQIVEYPRVLQRMGAGKIVLEFSDPGKTLKSLNSRWGFREVIIG